MPGAAAASQTQACCSASADLMLYAPMAVRDQGQGIAMAERRADVLCSACLNQSLLRRKVWELQTFTIAQAQEHGSNDNA